MSTGWFTDITDEPGHEDCQWQPFLQLNGMCLPLPIWFKTEADCNAFIASDLVNQPALDESRDKAAKG